MDVKIEKVNGFNCIASWSLKHFNIKYHAPYLARIDDNGEFDWQPKQYVGYGKRRDVYYDIEALMPGDLIQAAAGSGTNKYPFKGRVLSITDTILEVEELSDKEFGNLVAELVNKPKQTQVTIEELPI